MNSGVETKTLAPKDRWLSAFVSIVAIGLILKGILTILAWRLGWESWIEVYSYSPPITYPEAICFILSGISFLYAVRGNFRRVRFWGALVLFCAGAFILLPSLSLPFEVAKSVSELSNLNGLPAASQMGLLSALSFSLLGFALTMPLRPNFPYPLILGTVGAFLFTLGGACFSAYFTEIPRTPIWTRLEPMALESSLALCFGGCALLVLVWRSANEQPLPRPYRWISVPIILGGLTVSGLVWFTMNLRENKRLNRIAMEKSEDLRLSLGKNLNGALSPLLDFARTISERTSVLTRDEFGRRARSHIQKQMGVGAWAWYDGKLSLKMFNYTSDSPLEEPLENAWTSMAQSELEAIRDKKRFVYRGYKNEESGKPTFQIYIPIFTQGSFIGMLVGLFRVEPLLEAVTADAVFSDYRFGIEEGGRLLFSSWDPKESSGRRTRVRLNESALPWELVISHRSPAIMRYRSVLPEALLLLNFVFSALLGTLIFFIQATRLKAHESERIMKELSESEDFLRKQSIELMGAREVAMNASRQKSDFVAHMSHEIRNPISAIQGITELLLDTELSKEQKQFVGSIGSATQTLMELLTNTLDISKIEAGKLELEPDEFDFIDFLEQTVQVFDAAAKQKQVRLRLSVAPKVPRIVKADKLRLRQVLTNLIGNAIKFTQNARVTVRVEGKKVPGQVAHLKFTVSDEGTGIAVTDLERIFGSFEQAGSSDRNVLGSGLGLSISRALVRLMGGDISVRSQIGKGSDFWFSLEFPVGAATGNLKRGKFGKGNNGPRRRESFDILLAEDHPLNQLVMKKLLNRDGHNVEVVSDGEEAIDAYKRYDFDVVIMDCEMPRVDGWTAVRRIRMIESSKGRHIPIIALTANAMEPDRKRCLEAGMDDYLAKPVPIPVLMTCVRRLVKKSRPLEAKVSASRGTRKQLQSIEAKATVSPKVVRELVALEPDSPNSFLEGILQLFFSETPKNIWELRDLARMRKASGIRQISHPLRSACGNLGAERMMQIAHRLELEAMNGKWEEVSVKLDELEAEYRKVYEAWNKQLDRLQRKVA